MCSILAEFPLIKGQECVKETPPIPFVGANAVEFYLPEGAPREAILDHGKLEEF